MPDFIEDMFLPLTKGIRTPQSFCLWSGISAVAAALERRVWLRNSFGNVYPNLYVILVAPPGVGKYVIEHTQAMLREVNEPGTKIPAFTLASDSMSFASMVDEIGEAKKSRIVQEGTITYHSLIVAAEEFQVLLPAFIPEMIGKFNTLYNCKTEYRETRRTGPVRELIVEKPVLNLLAGAQPSYFTSTFPEEAWSTGFARRIIMVYDTNTPRLSLFHEHEIRDTDWSACVNWLSRASGLYGLVRWHPDAAKAIDEWYCSGEAPVPEHSKLEHYARSRAVFIHKLAIVSAVSRDVSASPLVVTESDIRRAMSWLFDAEETMPDVFRAMVGRSDIQVLEELHLHLTRIYMQSGNKPIHESVIMRFLLGRVPSDKARHILWGAEQSKIITRFAGTETYRPASKTEWEVE